MEYELNRNGSKKRRQVWRQTEYEKQMHEEVPLRLGKLHMLQWQMKKENLRIQMNELSKIFGDRFFYNNILGVNEPKIFIKRAKAILRKTEHFNIFLDYAIKNFESRYDIFNGTMDFKKLEAYKKIRSSEELIGMFIKEQCQLETGAKTSTNELHANYVSFSVKLKHKSLDIVEFSKILTRIYPELKKCRVPKNGKRGYSGIKLEYSKGQSSI